MHLFGYTEDDLHTMNEAKRRTVVEMARYLEHRADRRALMAGLAVHAGG